MPPLFALRRKALLLSLALFAAGCETSAAQSSGHGPPPPPAVGIGVAELHEIAPWNELSGRIEAIHHVDIRPRVSGYITAVRYREGSEVVAGQVLFTIDARPYQATLARAQADLARARSRADLARVESERGDALLAASAIPRAERDTLSSTRAQADAEVQAAQAQLALARLDVEFTEVKAPLAGRTGRALVSVGDYVAAESHLTCGACFQCRTGQAHVCKNYKILGIDRDGSYAQYVALPEGVLWHTAPDIPPELACVQEPLGNAVDAALAEDLTGHTVLIAGCGPTGLFAAAVARTSGAATIIAADVSDYRLGLAKQVGADHVLNAKTESPNQVEAAILDITGGEGVDAALEMSGDPTAMHQVFRAVKNGGRVTLFGIPTGPGQ